MKKKKKMYEAQQHFVDLQDNGNGFGDPNSWLSGDPNLSPTHRPNHTSLAGSGANLDRDLFKDLVEIVPLVQSLIVKLSLFFFLFFFFFYFNFLIFEISRVFFSLVCLVPEKIGGKVKEKIRS